MALPSTPYDPLFQEAGEKHGVDPAILKAIASVESDFRPDAVGPRTKSGQAKGMMQFVPATAKAYGLEDPFNPEQSVDAAARLMKDLTKQFDGDVGKALEAYNGGPRLVGRSKQTAAYRQKVLQRAKLADTTQFAQNKRTPMPEPTPRVSLSDVADMPASYKAAIALQYFTDTDPEGNPVDSAEQTLAALEQEQADLAYEQTKPAGGSLLQKFFSAKTEGSVSPFDIMAGMQQPEAASTDQGPEQVAQVQGFADGGFAFRGTSLPGMPNPYLNLQNVYTPEEREFLKRQEEAISQYEGGQEGYEKQMADYQAQVDAYNKRMESMTPQIEAYNKQLSDYEKQLAAYNEQVDLWNKHFVNATPGHEYYYYYLNRNSLNPDAIFASKNPVPTFNAQAPDFGPQPVAPKQPIPAGMTQAQYEQYVNQVNAKQGDIEGRRKQAAQQELALDVVQDPGKYNLAGFGFSQGGDASKEGMLEKVKRFIVENDLTPADFMLTPRTIPLGMMLQPSEANAGEAEELERYRRMAEQARGKVVGRAKGSGSRAEEVPQLDEFGRVILPEPEPEPEYSLLEKLYGVGEAAASVASSIPAAVVGSAYGAYKGLTSDKYGTPEGVREAEAAAGDVMKGMTFVPRGEAGQGYAESLSQIIPQELQGAMPQSQLMNLRVNPGAARYLGERAREGTEAAIMPVLRSQTENPNLRPEAVYGAMLGDPAQNIAGAAATYAIKPSGGAVRVEPIISNLSVKVNDAIDNFIESRLIPEGQTNVRQFADEKRKDVRDYASKKFASYYQKAGSPTDPLMQRFIEGKHQLPFESDELVSLIQAEVRDTLKTNRKDAKAGDKQAALELEKMYDMYLSDPMTISYGPQAVINLLNDPENAERFKRELLSQGYVYSPALADDAVNQILRTGRLEFTTDEGYFGDTAVAFSAASAMAKEIADKITAQGGNPNLSAIENSLQTGFRPNRAAELERTLAHEKDRLQKLGQVIEIKGASELQLVPLTGTMRKINDLTSEIENLRRGNVVYEFSPDSLFDIEDVADYMVQTPTEKWKNLEVQDLVAAAEKDYPRITDPKKIASRVKRNKKITKEQAFTGTSPVMPAESKTLPGAVWVELSPDATKIEGCMLGHCLQDERYDYAGKIARGQDRIFSLRDKDGKARVTIQATRFGMDPNAPHTVIKQIKGFSNESVMKGAERKYSKYELEDEVRDFLNEYAADQNRPLTFLEESTHIPPGMSRVFTQKQANDSPVITGIRKRLERMLQLMAPDFEAAGQTSIVTQDANALLKDLREAHANRRPDSEIVTLLYEFTNDLGTSYGYTAKDIKQMLNPFD
jgi:hypothetical protein